MSDRLYRLLLGTTLLVALYFQWQRVVLALIAMLLWEGVTNARVPGLVNGILAKVLGRAAPAGPACPVSGTRFSFEAERAWRLVAACILSIGVADYHDIFWFLPWFLGFGMLGAGLSGVCPMLITARWLGFR